VAPEAIVVLKDLQTNRLIFNFSNKQIPGVSLFLPTTTKKLKHCTVARKNDIVYTYFYLTKAFITY